MPMLRTIFFTGFLFVLAGKDRNPDIKVGLLFKKTACFPPPESDKEDTKKPLVLQGAPVK
jgi:hypothetical protein